MSAMVETVGAAAKEMAADAAASQLLFVIPAYNEEANLPTLFADLLQAEPLLGEGSRILIVDDGSADDTPVLVEAPTTRPIMVSESPSERA